MSSKNKSSLNTPHINLDTNSRKNSPNSKRHGSSEKNKEASQISFSGFYLAAPQQKILNSKNSKIQRSSKDSKIAGFVNSNGSQSKRPSDNKITSVGSKRATNTNKSGKSLGSPIRQRSVQ